MERYIVETQGGSKGYCTFIVVLLTFLCSSTGICNFNHPPPLGEDASDRFGDSVVSVPLFARYAERRFV